MWNTDRSSVKTLSVKYREQTNALKILRPVRTPRLAGKTPLLRRFLNDYHKQRHSPLPYLCSSLSNPVFFRRFLWNPGLIAFELPPPCYVLANIMLLAANVDNAEQDTHGRRTSSYKPPVRLRNPAKCMQSRGAWLSLYK